MGPTIPEAPTSRQNKSAKSQNPNKSAEQIGKIQKANKSAERSAKSAADWGGGGVAQWTPKNPSEHIGGVCPAHYFCINYPDFNPGFTLP